MFLQPSEKVESLPNADLDFTPGTDPRYSFYVTDLNYGGIPQRAVVVWSEEMKKRNDLTFNKKIQKETDAAQKELKKLMSRKFACVPDAENEAKIWASAHPHHCLKNIRILPVMEKVEKRRGRPKKNEALNLSSKIVAEIEVNENALTEERKRLGRFV